MKPGASSLKKKKKKKEDPPLAKLSKWKKNGPK